MNGGWWRRIALGLMLAVSSLARASDPVPADGYAVEARADEIRERSLSATASLGGAVSEDRFLASLAPVDEAGKAVLGQGQVFMVTINDPERRIASARALWAGQVAPCLSLGDRTVRRGLAVVDRDHAPGIYEVEVRVETTDGRELKTALGLTVKETQYGREVLRVAPDKVEVPESQKKRVAEEGRAFSEIWDSPAPGRFWDGPFLRPTGGRVTSAFGEKRVYNGRMRSRHGGVDLAAPTGEPILATAAGRVRMVRDCFIEGGTVVVDHGGGVFTYYCHLSKMLAKPGDYVEAGDPVGLAGATGRVTGPHLHWGLKVQGVRGDPLSLLALGSWFQTGRGELLLLAAPLDSSLDDGNSAEGRTGVGEGSTADVLDGATVEAADGPTAHAEIEKDGGKDKGAVKKSGPSKKRGKKK